ncbi:amidohydrolase [Patescibacteria group bacterium]
MNYKKTKRNSELKSPSGFLVNAHTHAAMVAFRGVAEDVPLEKWLNDYIWPAEKEQVSAEFVYKNSKKAIKEMKQNGIAAFCDMYFFQDQVAKAAKEEGVQAVIGEVILDFPTPSSKAPQEALQITERLLKKYLNDPDISVAVAPHSIYAVSKEILVAAKELARKYDAIYHIHVAETKREFDECLEKNKLTPVAYLDSLGILDEKTLLAHCVWVTDEDIEILARRKSSVAHCPLSNLKLGSGVAPISKMIRKGVNVCLGTDGAASSNRLDIWEAGKFAALLQKGLSLSPEEMPIEQVLNLMTINGMRALGIEKVGGKTIDQIKSLLKEEYTNSALYELNYY